MSSPLYVGSTSFQEKEEKNKSLAAQTKAEKSPTIFSIRGNSSVSLFIMTVQYPSSRNRKYLQRHKLMYNFDFRSSACLRNVLWFIHYKCTVVFLLCRDRMSVNGFSTEEDSRQGHDQICCLIDSGDRCNNSAGNASYSKRIQKTVQQRKLKLSRDDRVIFSVHFCR